MVMTDYVLPYTLMSFNETMYSEPQFGFSSVKSLTYWTAASLSCMHNATTGCNGSESWTVIQVYYQKYWGINITDFDMFLMVGDNTLIRTSIGGFEDTIISQS